MARKTASTDTAARRPRPEAPGSQGQLRLVIDDSRTPWRLDETTRAIGREGVARAREVLQSSRAHELGSAA